MGPHDRSIHEIYPAGHDGNAEAGAVVVTGHLKLPDADQYRTLAAADAGGAAYLVQGGWSQQCVCDALGVWAHHFAGVDIAFVHQPAS